MTKTTAFVLALMASAAVASTANAAFVVSYEGEAPGVENTTATFSVGGVETFDSQTPYAYPNSFTTTFGTSGTGGTINGTYTADTGNGVEVLPADQYGGAGGTGNYIVAFSGTPYSLSLATDIPGGVNYFGYWLSALDKGNFVTFYGESGQKLFTFNPQDVIDTINTHADPSQYYGNPNTVNYLHGQNSSEPYVFVNFFDKDGSFSKVSFSENGGGGYESDNHTVGHYLTQGQGTTVTLNNSVSGVPETSTWAMMILGVGAIGAVLRRRRAPAASAATA